MSNSQKRINGGCDLVCDHQARERKSTTRFGSRRFNWLNARLMIEAQYGRGSIVSGPNRLNLMRAI